jgi:hypothetical protein
VKIEIAAFQLRATHCFSECEGESMSRKSVADSELRSIIQAEIAAADGQANSELSNERSQNMDYYQCRPFGNEVDGRSSVVSSDVRDTIEWILPTIIRIFCSGEDAVEFEPENESEIAMARQATDYANFVWNRDNRGFVNFYSWFKDALLQKNGVIKIWWDDTPKIRRERYKGLDDTTFTWLVNDPDVEVAEHTEHRHTIEVPRPDDSGAIVPTPMELASHDLVLTRKIPGGRVRILPVPPEEFLISGDARDIEHARFVGHRRRRTISELIAEGYDRALVENLVGDETAIGADAEEIGRNTVEDQSFASGDAVNPAMRQVWVTEGYLRADVDGDGIAEMRKVVVAGAGQEILSNEAWDTVRPFAGLTPIIMPHRYHGLAVADMIRDIQLIKSTIMRQYLDNLYLSNNQREQVVEANIVDPSEVLSAAPGRKIRVKNGPAVFPIEVPSIGAEALAGLAYIDQLRENRTGVSERTQGLGSNQLHDTAAGERMLMTAAMGKIELIARIFAETGVKDAFRLILKLVCRYQDCPRSIPAGSNWAAMDPSRWNSDMDMTVRVGMGMGDKDQQLSNAMMLGNLQRQALPLGFVTPENFKNAAEIAVNAMGLKGVDRFFTFPPGGGLQGGQAGPPPHGDPKAQAEMARTQSHIQNEQARTASHIQLAGFKVQQEAALKAFQTQQELALRHRQIELEHRLNLAQTAVRMGGQPG